MEIYATLGGQTSRARGSISVRLWMSCHWFRSYGQARWLYEIPGMATDPESDEWADGVNISGSFSILVLGLAPVGMDPCTVSPQFKRRQ